MVSVVYILYFCVLSREGKIALYATKAHRKNKKYFSPLGKKPINVPRPYS